MVLEEAKIIERIQKGIFERKPKPEDFERELEKTCHSYTEEETKEEYLGHI